MAVYLISDVTVRDTEAFDAYRTREICRRRARKGANDFVINS
jgi:hypothetical protein